MIRLYGITEKGNSVCLIVENFYPYFYVLKPPDFTEDLIEEFKEDLMQKIESKQKQPHYIKSIEIIKKTNIYNYTDKTQEYIKIILYQPKNVSLLRDLFEKGFGFNGIIFDRITYESKINFPLRFMIDNNIVGMSWVKIPSNKYEIKKYKISHCQIECWCDVENIEPLSTSGDYSIIAPLRILSIDIECTSKISNC